MVNKQNKGLFCESETKNSGSEKIIDLVLTVHKDMTICKGHDICNTIEQEIMQSLYGAKVFIHLEPCENEYGICS